MEYGRWKWNGRWNGMDGHLEGMEWMDGMDGTHGDAETMDNGRILLTRPESRNRMVDGLTQNTIPRQGRRDKSGGSVYSRSISHRYA